MCTVVKPWAGLLGCRLNQMIQVTMNFHLPSLWLTLGLMWAYPLHAQSLLTGQVLDDSTDQPLAYVRLSLAQGQRGTLSNEEGRFQLRLPAQLAGDTLEVFVLGYVPQRLPLTQLPAESMTLRLQPRPLELSTVTILSETPFRLLRRAVDRIPDNYPDGNWSWQGFYREIENWNFLRMQDKDISYPPQRSITIGEALVEVVMPAYQAKDQPQVRLLKGRIIEPEDLLQDSLDDGIRQMVAGLEDTGGPPGQAAFDAARDPGRFSFLAKRGDKWYTYELRGVIPYQGRPAYRIDFHQRPDKEDSRSLLDGTVYLDTASLAFVSIRFELSEDAQLYTPEFSALGIRLKITDERGRLEYRPQGDRWTLAYNDYGNEIYLGVPDGFMFQKSFQLDSYLRYRRELLMTDLRSQQAAPIPKEEQFRDKEALSEEVGEYDPTFWAGQAILPVEASLLKQR